MPDEPQTTTTTTTGPTPTTQRIVVNMPENPPPTPDPPGDQTGINKAVASGLAGAFTTVVAYMINKFTGEPLPTEVAMAIQAIITFGVVWIVPHGRR